MAKSVLNTKVKEPGEFTIWLVDHRFNLTSAKIQNDSLEGTAAAITVDDVIGQPVVNNAGVWEFANATTVGTAIDGYVYDGQPIKTSLVADALTDFPYAICTDGPALINEGQIPATDVYGNAITASEYIAAVLALGIKSVSVPTKTTDQTT